MVIGLFVTIYIVQMLLSTISSSITPPPVNNSSSSPFGNMTTILSQTTGMYTTLIPLLLILPLVLVAFTVFQMIIGGGGGSSGGRSGSSQSSSSSRRASPPVTTWTPSPPPSTAIVNPQMGGTTTTTPSPHNAVKTFVGSDVVEAPPAPGAMGIAGMLHVNGKEINLSPGATINESDIPGTKGGVGSIVGQVVHGDPREPQTLRLKNMGGSDWSVFRKVKCQFCGKVNDAGVATCSNPSCGATLYGSTCETVRSGETVVIADGVFIKFGIYTGEIHTT